MFAEADERPLLRPPVVLRNHPVAPSLGPAVVAALAILSSCCQDGEDEHRRAEESEDEFEPEDLVWVCLATCSAFVEKTDVDSILSI